MIKIAVFASGGGSNLQALIDAQDAGTFPKGRLSLVFSNVPTAGALERAEKHRIESVSIASKGYPGTREAYDRDVLGLCQAKRIDLICLAGYMRILTPVLIRPYLYRMMNIHPALLPKFGGEGMYGHHVHEAVIRSKERESGATVHFVTEGVDAGPIILQGDVKVLPGDTPETLADRVLKVEHRLYPEAVRLFCEGKIKVVEDRVRILN
ncbi:MAG TPA: phosphoribosylglycinamide formyltransferase [bacterium]|nr:phosphoribosylglycinamide formyltransferase [bacterium]